MKPNKVFINRTYKTDSRCKKMVYESLRCLDNNNGDGTQCDIIKDLFICRRKKTGTNK